MAASQLSDPLALNQFVINSEAPLRPQDAGSFSGKAQISLGAAAATIKFPTSASGIGMAELAVGAASTATAELVGATAFDDSGAARPCGKASDLAANTTDKKINLADILKVEPV